MNKQLIQTISEARTHAMQNGMLSDIVVRVRHRYFERAEHEIVIHEIVDYVMNQLLWKKQSTYQYLLPILLECCDVVDENFESLFDNPRNYREAYDQIT